MLTPHTIVARYISALTPAMKSHPIQGKVEKAAELFKKLAAAMARDAKAVDSHTGYRGDASKVGPAMERIFANFEKLETLYYKGLRREGNSYLSEKARESDSPIDDRTFEAAEKPWDKAYSAFLSCEKNVEEAKKKLAEGQTRILDLLADSIARDAADLAQHISNFAFHLSYLTRAQLEAPMESGKKLSPVETIESFMNSQVVGLAKAAAKKLKGDQVACAVLGGEVLEDVNAHTAFKAIMPLLDGYYKAVNADEAKYKAVRSLVGQVSSGLQWDILRSAAFSVAIMRAVKCPEAHAVLEKLADAFDKQGLFSDE